MATRNVVSPVALYWSNANCHSALSPFSTPLLRIWFLWLGETRLYQVQDRCLSKRWIILCDKKILILHVRVFHQIGVVHFGMTDAVRDLQSASPARGVISLIDGQMFIRVQLFESNKIVVWNDKVAHVVLEFKCKSLTSICSFELSPTYLPVGVFFHVMQHNVDVIELGQHGGPWNVFLLFA